MRRLIEKMTSKRLIILSVIILIVIGLFYIPAFAADTFVGTHAAGTDTTFTVTETATYEFDLYGSQGGNKDTFTGGKGGHVKFTIPLKVGDKVQIVVGNQSGVGGGGTGTASNGGGATYIKVNDNLIGVAGGGGGATTTQNGLPGGTADAGNNNIALQGDSSEEENSGGGGAGYKGGTAGYFQAEVTQYCGEITREHTYRGQAHNSACASWYYYNCYCTNCGTTTGFRCTANDLCGAWGQAYGSHYRTFYEVDTKAYGGSNYIDSTATTIVNEGDTREGTGSITVCKLITITLDSNKPEGAKAEPVIKGGITEVVIRYGGDKSEELPFVTLEGYTFNGWNTKADGSGDKILLAGEIDTDTTLYATYKGAVVNVMLDPNNALVTMDEELKSFQRNYGANYDLPTLNCEGQVFLGWYTEPNGGTKVNSTDKVRPEPSRGENEFGVEVLSYSITLYAHWELPSYTITFDPNGGTCSITSKKVTNYSEIGTLPTPVRGDTTFEGWYTEKVGGILVTEKTIAMFDTDITLYAHWSAEEFSIGVNTYTVPYNGYYKLEAWGAQGGNYGSYTGGLGGYAKGIVYLEKGTVVQVNVGKQGDTFNGGGAANSSTYPYAYGGGATDFRIGGTAIENQVVVAGGGGGASGWENGLPGSDTTGLTSTRLYGQNGHTGGGGGYYGGKSGKFEQHWCSAHNTSPCYSYVVVAEGWWIFTGGPYPKDTAGNEYTYDCSLCGYHERNTSGRGGTHCTQSDWRKTCGCTSGQIMVNDGAYGGSNYINENYLLPENKYGIKRGHGKATITPLYAALLDVSNPNTQNNYEVNSSNKGFIDNVDTVIDETKLPFITPSYSEFGTAENDKIPFGLILFEKGRTVDTHGELPIPSLKGWKFLGWYTEPQIDTNNKITNDTVVQITDTTKLMNNPVLYAHWQEETYYIKYYKANTNLNIYNDEITNPEAVFDTTLASKSETKLYKYDAVEDCYIQTVKYDHDIKVLPNYYAKTGYYFKNWTNQADTNLAGTVGIGTGTGKQTGKTYYESEILKQNKVGEQFLETFGNFNYITNEKEMALDSTIEPIWSYGSDTVIMYATWEPIKYQLRFNGTNNWNTTQGSYLQNVVDSTGKQSTTIRYDQIFTLDANRFTRNAPFTIESTDGLPVTLKTGYAWIGWGFGKPTMKYSTPAWNLIAVNTEYDPDQALIDLAGVTGRDYVNQQASVKNVISADGIKTIEKYISDWSNARTDSNRADKQSLEDNIIESNLHSLWRRQAQGDATTNPPDSGGGNTPGSGTGSDGEDPNSDNFGITITFDLNGGEWLDDSNKPTTEPIVLKQELFNEYYYEFDIIGNTNTDLLNKSVIFDAYGKKSNTDPSKNYDKATGLNYTFRKSDEQGNKYRFCGWSLEQGQISADYNVTIDGITNNNFDVYDVSKNNKTIKVANDLTLYAIWEPELTLNVHLFRKLGGSTKISGSLTNANQTSVKAKGIPEVMIKPGEEGRYLVTLNSLHKGTVPVTNDSGELVYLYRPIDVEVTFDPVMTGIYAANNIAIKDNLNIITSADGSEPMLETSSLNRKITGIKDSSLSRNFHVPAYLGTAIAEANGYPSFKAEGYDLNITASRYSNFHKGIETVTAEFKIKTTKNVTTGGGTGTGTGGTGTGGSGGGTGSTPTNPSGIGTTLDELRTKLKIKLH